MYDDLTEEEAVSLAIDHVARSLPVPAKLRSLLPAYLLELLTEDADDTTEPTVSQS